jgi:two-component system phosphate regulon sensor histidine kinase PhoR
LEIDDFMLDFVMNDGLEFAGYLQGGIKIMQVVCVAGAVGVIALGWYWLKLAGIITSIARLIDDSGRINPGSADNFLYPFRIKQMEQLYKAVKECFIGRAAGISDYQKQINQLNIQIQIAQRREKNTEAIIYSIRDAVIVIDEYERLVMANEAAEKIFNFDFKSSRHKTLKELINNDSSNFLDFLGNGGKSKGQAVRREIELLQDGSIRTYDCIVSCVNDQGGQICGMAAVLHDITREKEVSQMKNEFVSHVSHELKTPLASITAYSEMLVDGEADDEKTRTEFYTVIQTQAKRLNRLIEDILNTSRIESGLIKINKEPVSLTILIKEQLQMIKSYAEEKNITVTTQKPIVYDQIYVDKDMISQAIVNLLSNAVKYTKPGGTVRIDTDVSDAEGLVRVSITDSGVGIPQDEIGHLFEKYYRVDANKKQASGTGLGLALVKQIIEKLHGGKVFVKSQVGVGSTFGFELPLATQVTAGAA